MQWRKIKLKDGHMVISTVGKKSKDLKTFFAQCHKKGFKVTRIPHGKTYKESLKYEHGIHARDFLAAIKSLMEK